MKIEIPLPEKISTNSIYSGTHWTKRSQQKQLYRHSLCYIKPEKVFSYPVTIDYLFTFKSRPLDTTNCAYMAKLIEDSLVHNKVLDDDSPKYVKTSRITSQKGEVDSVIVHIIENV